MFDTLFKKYLYLRVQAKGSPQFLLLEQNTTTFKNYFYVQKYRTK